MYFFSSCRSRIRNKPLRKAVHEYWGNFNNRLVVSLLVLYIIYITHTYLNMKLIGNRSCWGEAVHPRMCPDVATRNTLVVAFSLHARSMGERRKNHSTRPLPPPFLLFFKSGDQVARTIPLLIPGSVRPAAQRAETTVDERFLISCAWVRFPDRFPYYAWVT